MTRDERIARALGLCWHKWDRHGICEKCGLPENIRDLAYRSNPDFSTWEDFGLIFERGPNQGWWKAFLRWWNLDFVNGYAMIAPSSGQEPFEVLLLREFNPPIFADKLDEFLQENGEK